MTARTDRETKILEVAADMLVRHGYRRVTIDDVAGAAGIGKGTVYLHWKTREELFGAVFAREVRGAIADMVTALRADPAVALLHRFAAEFFLAILRRPLLYGMVPVWRYSRTTAASGSITRKVKLSSRYSCTRSASWAR